MSDTTADTLSFPDKVGKDRAGDICVRFNGEIQRPRFNSTGAADVYLTGLRDGTRKAEPEPFPCS